MDSMSLTGRVSIVAMPSLAELGRIQNLLKMELSLSIILISTYVQVRLVRFFTPQAPVLLL